MHSMTVVSLTSITFKYQTLAKVSGIIKHRKRTAEMVGASVEVLEVQ